MLTTSTSSFILDSCNLNPHIDVPQISTRSIVLTPAHTGTCSHYPDPVTVGPKRGIAITSAGRHAVAVAVIIASHYPPGHPSCLPSPIRLHHRGAQLLSNISGRQLAGAVSPAGLQLSHPSQVAVSVPLQHPCRTSTLPLPDSCDTYPDELANYIPTSQLYPHPSRRHTHSHYSSTIYEP